MKKYIRNLSLILVWSIIQCTNTAARCENIKNGLYYGHNKRFFPQTAVFVHIKDSLAFAEGFYPFKGMLFATFADTLFYSAEKNIFYNEKSRLYLENNKLYFEREDSLPPFRVEKARLKDKRSNKSNYDSSKEKAIPYHSFWEQE